MFCWNRQKEFSSERQVFTNSTFYECLMCPDYSQSRTSIKKSLSQFRFDNKYETLVDHQKDEHDIEYSSEFLSQPVNESLAQQVILNVKSIILPMIKVQKVTVKTKIILLNMLKRPVRFKL